MFLEYTNVSWKGLCHFLLEGRSSLHVLWQISYWERCPVTNTWTAQINYKSLNQGQCFEKQERMNEKRKVREGGREEKGKEEKEREGAGRAEKEET